MKRYILLLLLVLPLSIMAQRNDDAKYLRGAVPQDSTGLVIFTQRFATDKTKDENYNILRTWAATVAENGIHEQRTRLIEADSVQGIIIYRIEEWMVFHRAFLNLDRTRFRYTLTIQVGEQEASISLSQISYYYEEDQNGENGRLYKAEEWITDSEALNRRGTRLYRYSAKFRRKTIDRAEELFTQARESFEEERRATRVLN